MLLNQKNHPLVCNCIYMYQIIYFISPPDTLCKRQYQEHINIQPGSYNNSVEPLKLYVNILRIVYTIIVSDYVLK